MAENEKTEHYKFPKPNIANNISDDTPVLQVAFDMVDAVLKLLAGEIAKKRASNEKINQEDIDGLVEALAKKMNDDKTFKLIDMTDVSGVGNALDNYILTKAGAGFVFRSALAVIGAHTHNIAEVDGLQNVLNTFLAGASSSTDGEVILFQGTGGKQIKGSGVKLSDLILSIDSKATSAQLSALNNAIVLELNAINSSLSQKLGKTETAANSSSLGGETAAQWQAKIDDLPTGGLGIDQTWQNVTGSRSFGTYYQNTSGKPIEVSITFRNSSTNIAGVLLRCGIDTSSLENVSELTRAGEASGVSRLSIYAVIPPNHFYRAESTSGIILLVRWMELR